MTPYKTATAQLEAASVPKQSAYQEYHRVGEREDRTSEHVLACGLTVHATATHYDYGSGHGKSTNKHRWVYGYDVYRGLEYVGGANDYRELKSVVAGLIAEEA